MKFSQAAEILGGVPFISSEHAKQLYDFIVESGVRDVLELGHAHGTSTCYMAAALDELGSQGMVTTMDRFAARERKPNLDELLARTGLGHLVEPVYCVETYTWELMKVIEHRTEAGVCKPGFDLCFIDGAHTWETDGMAFFLVDKLLRPGGWVLFDDLPWRYADDPKELEKPRIKRLPEEMKTTPQVGKVFSLLVSQHPNYGDFRVEGDWGWARKVANAPTATKAGPGVMDRVYGAPTIRRDAYLLTRRVADRLLRGKTKK